MNTLPTELLGGSYYEILMEENFTTPTESLHWTLFERFSRITQFYRKFNGKLLFGCVQYLFVRLSLTFVASPPLVLFTHALPANYKHSQPPTHWIHLRFQLPNISQVIFSK